MNKQQYMDKLYSLLTPSQKALFNRMYPSSPDSSQLKWATTQIENTIGRLNDKNEEFYDFRKQSILIEDEFNIVKSEYRATITNLESELKEAYAKIERLSNPLSLDISTIHEKLELLNALEAGGVDNWEWYSESISQYKENN